MEIKATGPSGPSGLRRVNRSAAQADGTFKAAETSEPTRAQTISGPGPLAAVETILTLQAFDDSTDGRSKGLAHGEDLLDILDRIRDGLLAGSIPRVMLHHLASVISKKPDVFVDPKLQNVLDEIDLRARVELAKLEMADARVS